jgi:hypothetical protein
MHAAGSNALEQHFAGQQSEYEEQGYGFASM